MAQAAIGIVSGLLSIIKFGMDTFAEKPKAGSTYKVAVGLDGPSGLSNAGGNMPDVSVSPFPLISAILTISQPCF